MRTALALLMLAGCWTSSSGGAGSQGGAEEPSAAPPPIVVPKRMFSTQTRTRTPYAELAGKWIGHGIQSDNSDWDITLDITADPVAIGEEVGKVDYPGLACGGVLIRRAEHPDGVLVAGEKITYGTRCVDGGSFEFPARPTAESFAWQWFGTNGQVQAEGTVRRRK